MSPIILDSVKMNLQKYTTINEFRQEVLIKDMKLWRKDTIIYPNRIKSLLRISYQEAYAVLDILKNMTLLEYNYEIYCSKCERFLDIPRLKSLNQFPEELFCEKGHQLRPFKDTVLVYKVIKDE